jgi:hypothetical protein
MSDSHCRNQADWCWRLALGVWRSRSCRLLTSDQSLITDYLSRPVLGFLALSALPALSHGLPLLPRSSGQQHSHGREAHDQSSGPAKNLEVQRKRELAHYLSIAGHEHHETHHGRGGNSVDHSSPHEGVDRINLREIEQ